MVESKMVPTTCPNCRVVNMIPWVLIVELGCNMAVTCRSCEMTTWYPTTKRVQGVGSE